MVEDFRFGGAEFAISEAPLNKYVIVNRCRGLIDRSHNKVKYINNDRLSAYGIIV